MWMEDVAVGNRFAMQGGNWAKKIIGLGRKYKPKQRLGSKKDIATDSKILELTYTSQGDRHQS